jgi:lysozyme
VSGVNTSNYIEGCDVSHHNSRIDWRNVASLSRIKFAFCKATEGSRLVDPEFSRNWQLIKEAGLYRGAYHFFKPNVAAREQATHFIKVVKEILPGDLPPALDVEWTNDRTSAPQLVEAVATWVDLVEITLGRKPIIYTAAAYWDDALHGTSRFGMNPLWVTHYTLKDQPRIPQGWRTWALWQHTAEGKIPGRELSRFCVSGDNQLFSLERRPDYATDPTRTAR